MQGMVVVAATLRFIVDLGVRQYHCARENQQSTEPVMPTQVLMQEDRSQHDGYHDAQFVHRRDS